MTPDQAGVLQDVILKEHKQRLENAVEMAAKLQRNEETLLRGKMDSVSHPSLPSYPGHAPLDASVCMCSCGGSSPEPRRVQLTEQLLMGTVK